VYHQKLFSFHTSDKKPASALRISDGNSNRIVTNLIYSQIHKSPKHISAPGFCYCSRQSAGEELRQQCISTSKHTQWVECSTLWRSRFRRYTYLDEIQVAYHHNGEAEYVLSVVSRLKVKSRQRVGSRSDIGHQRPGQRHGLTPKYKPDSLVVKYPQRPHWLT